MGEYTNDAKEKIATGGIKYDGGKAPIYRGAISYFPRAIEAVAAVSAFGANKYAWGGWRSVDNGIDRYSDAMVRHLASIAKGEDVDPDSGHSHLAHVAWNALAVLELAREDEEKLEAWAYSIEGDEMVAYINGNAYLNPELPLYGEHTPAT